MTAATPKLKIFTGSHLFVPNSWLNALGSPAHHQQCHVVVVAASKADIEGLLTERYVSFTASRMAAALRLARTLSVPVRLLVEAGVIDTAARGVYAYRDAVKDQPVIRVETDGSCSVAGHFRLPDFFGRMTAEREDRDEPR
jgi:hypothetical protein